MAPSVVFDFIGAGLDCDDNDDDAFDGNAADADSFIAGLDDADDIRDKR